MEQYISKSALLAEIERLVNNYDKALDYEAALEDVRNFIDSIEVKKSAELQHVNETCKENGNSLTQELVNVWHDAQTEQPQAKEKILATNEYGDCEVDFAINMALYWKKVIKWAYIEDLLNLSNVQRTVKNCKEPASNVWHDMSEDAENGRNTIIIDPKGFYGVVLRKGGSQLRNRNKERYVKWAYIDDIINITNQEEPAKDELGKAAVEAFKQIVDSNKNNFLEIFKAGVKWQKEQMMEKAVDGVVTFDYYEGDKAYGCVAHDSFCLEDLGLKDMDEVKILILKK